MAHEGREKIYMTVAQIRWLAEDRDSMLKPSKRRVGRRHLLHVFASFGLGGVPIRISEVINALPDGFRHTIVALDACFDARKRVAPHVDATFRGLTLPKYCLPCSLLQIRRLI